MSNSKFLLHSNAAIALINADSLFLQRFTFDSEFSLPIIALAELFYGAQKSGRPSENVTRIRQLAGSLDVVSCDAATAEMWGKCRYELHRKGTPIPQNDLWIAAIALQHGFTVVTRDAHFGQVQGLQTIAW